MAVIIKTIILSKANKTIEE